MRRKKPLVRRTPLRTRPNRARALLSATAAALWDERRAEVYRRCGGLCEGCGGALRGFDAHHRKLRSRGGTDEMDNVVALHRSCHEWVHANPHAATDLGLMVRSTDDPAQIPLRLYGITSRANEVWLGVEYEVVTIDGQGA